MRRPFKLIGKPSPALARRFASLLLLHLAGAVAGYASALVHVPLAWMIGPMLISAAAALFLNTPEPPIATRATAQIVIGCAIGLYLTPEALATVLDSAVPILLSAIFIIIGGFLIGLAQMRIMGTHIATAIYSCVPGGPSEMANLAHQFGGSAAQTSLAQTIRIVAIVVLFPVLLIIEGAEMLPLASTTQPVNPLGLLAAAPILVGSSFVARRLRLLNPFLLGPMLVVGALTAAGAGFSGIPIVLVYAAQVLLGVSLGSMFRRDRLFSASRFLIGTVVTTALLLGYSIALAVGCVRFFGLDLYTMLLANAPGSVTEMAITAKATRLDVSLVAAFHMARILLIMTLTPLIYKAAVRTQSVANSRAI